MKLITKEIAKKLPALGALDGQGLDAQAQLKLFTPWTNWTWYATEYDPRDRVCFGWAINGADPDSAELGYFSLQELEEVKGPFGFRVERDLYWEPRSLRQCMKDHGRTPWDEARS
jgi:hypothetical protein